MILGLTGKAGSGKNAVAEILREKFNYRELAFADNLKEAAALIFQVDLKNFYDRGLKEIVIPRWKLSPREMAQKLGTEACRTTFGDDVWINSLLPKLDNYGYENNVVITDVRFENEANMVRVHGGVIVHVHTNRESRLNTLTFSHISEAGVKATDKDFHILNYRSLEELPETVEIVLQKIEGTR